MQLGGMQSGRHSALQWIGLPPAALGRDRVQAGELRLQVLPIGPSLDALLDLGLRLLGLKRRVLELIRVRQLEPLLGQDFADGHALWHQRRVHRELFERRARSRGAAAAQPKHVIEGVTRRGAIRGRRAAAE